MKDQKYQFIKGEDGKVSIAGLGSYGKVKLARNSQTKQIVAIKMIYKNAKEQIDVHHKLNHPNIIRLLNYNYDKQKDVTYMILQYAQSGTLSDKIKFGLGQLSKRFIKQYFKDICNAVKYLHQNNYMHRDIKPQNILLTKDLHAKLCDFGFAALFQYRSTLCGTYQYMSPQMIQKKPYDHKIDIWALGILLFEMINGTAPFRGDSGQQVISQMKKPLAFGPRFEPQQIDLIKKILRVNAEKRPTIQQILQHEYFIQKQQDLNLYEKIQKEDKIQGQTFRKRNNTFDYDRSALNQQKNMNITDQGQKIQKNEKIFKPYVPKNINQINNNKNQILNSNNYGINNTFQEGGGNNYKNDLNSLIKKNQSIGNNNQGGIKNNFNPPPTSSINNNYNQGNNYMINMQNNQVSNLNKGISIMNNNLNNNNMNLMNPNFGINYNPIKPNIVSNGGNLSFNNNSNNNNINNSINMNANANTNTGSNGYNFGIGNNNYGKNIPNYSNNNLSNPNIQASTSLTYNNYPSSNYNIQNNYRKQ